MLEYFKLTRYAKLFEEYISNDETIIGKNKLEDVKVNAYYSVSEIVSKLKKV